MTGEFKYLGGVYQGPWYDKRRPYEGRFHYPYRAPDFKLPSLWPPTSIPIDIETEYTDEEELEALDEAGLATYREIERLNSFKRNRVVDKVRSRREG